MRAHPPTATLFGIPPAPPSTRRRRIARTLPALSRPEPHTRLRPTVATARATRVAAKCTCAQPKSAPWGRQRGSLRLGGPAARSHHSAR
eukprot:3709600-Pyramimonas_sp.AAC.1